MRLSEGQFHCTESMLFIHGSMIKYFSSSLSHRPKKCLTQLDPGDDVNTCVKMRLK